MKKILITLLFLAPFLSVANAFDKQRCLEVPDNLLYRFESLLVMDGEESSIPEAVAVKSVTSAGDDIHHIIVEIDGLGLMEKGDHARFAKKELNNNGYVYSVNHVAVSFFPSFPDFTNKLGYKSSDPDGWDLATECMKSRQN